MLRLVLICALLALFELRGCSAISEKERERIVAKYSTRHTDANSKPSPDSEAGGETSASSSSSAMDMDLRKRANRTYEKVCSAE